MSKVTYTDPPFGSYAELIQKLLPSVSKVAFYNSDGVAQWISDGREDAKQHQFVRSVLRHRQQIKNEPCPAAYVPSASQSIYLIPLCEPRNLLVCMLLLVCRPPTESTKRVDANQMREQIRAVLDIVLYEYRRYGVGLSDSQRFAR